VTLASSEESSGQATMTAMRLADKVLVHQAHPAKIGMDVTASMVSNVLLWRGRPRAALVVRILLSAAGSAAVLGLADLEELAKTRRGEYLLDHMPPAAQAIRLAGDAVMGFGAHRHSRLLLLTGSAVIVAGWSQGAWPQRW